MTEGNHTPLPWPAVEYDNDAGDDGGFWEWWEVPGVAKFDKEADAKLARTAVNGYAAVTAQRDQLTKVLVELLVQSDPFRPGRGTDAEMNARADAVAVLQQRVAS